MTRMSLKYACEMTINIGLRHETVYDAVHLIASSWTREGQEAGYERSEGGGAGCAVYFVMRSHSKKRAMLGRNFLKIILLF